jgi:hypothetical protein
MVCGTHDCFVPLTRLLLRTTALVPAKRSGSLALLPLYPPLAPVLVLLLYLAPPHPTRPPPTPPPIAFGLRARRLLNRAYRARGEHDTHQDALLHVAPAPKHLCNYPCGQRCRPHCAPWAWPTTGRAQRHGACWGWGGKGINKIKKSKNVYNDYRALALARLWRF